MSLNLFHRIPVLASGVYALPGAPDRLGLIVKTLEGLYREDRLDQLAPIDTDHLASAIASGIPIPHHGLIIKLFTTDNKDVITSLRRAPVEPKRRGECIFAAAMELYGRYQSVPIRFQQLLDGFLVEQELLLPFRPKYL